MGKNDNIPMLFSGYFGSIWKKIKKSIIENQLFKKKFKKKMKKDFVYSKNGRIFATSKHENESCLT